MLSCSLLSPYCTMEGFHSLLPALSNLGTWLTLPLVYSSLLGPRAEGHTLEKRFLVYLRTIKGHLTCPNNPLVPLLRSHNPSTSTRHQRHLQLSSWNHARRPQPTLLILSQLPINLLHHPCALRLLRKHFRWTAHGMFIYALGRSLLALEYVLGYRQLSLLPTR